LEEYLKKYLILVLLSLIWGSSFILMKKGLEFYSFTQVAALRLFFASIALFPFLYKAIKEVKQHDIIPLIIVGVIGNGIPAFLFAEAQIYLESSVIGILNSLTPIFTLVFAILFFKYKYKTSIFIGVIFGFLGACLLYFQPYIYSSTHYTFLSFVVLATICYAISINVISRYLHTLSSITISTVSLFLLTPFSLYYIFNSGFFSMLKSNEAFLGLGYISILGVIGTAFALIIFNYLIKISTSIFAASVTYLIPIVAIIWGVLDGEEITSFEVFATFFILIGVYLVNKKD